MNKEEKGPNHQRTESAHPPVTRANDTPGVKLCKDGKQRPIT